MEPPSTERTLLLVDDEENILSSLVRLFRRDGYRLLKATGGEAALELLARNEVGVILSDQRMPGMTGVEFLSRVKTLYPETVRLILSGYTDLNSVTDAINRGAIYRFLTKPWEDDLLRQNVADAFRQFEIVRENERLSRELRAANAALSEANQELERRVEERTRQLHRSLKVLQASQELLEHLPVAVIGVDSAGMIAVANAMAHQFFADGSGVLIGESGRERLPGDLFAVCGRGRAAQADQRLRLSDGRAAHYWCYPMGPGTLVEGHVWVLLPE